MTELHLTNFMLHFLTSNLFISVIILFLFAAKRLLKTILTSQAQYQLWFPLLGLLAVPFLPAHFLETLQIFSLLENLRNISAQHVTVNIEETTVENAASASNWMNDFTLSVSKEAPSGTGLLLLVLWLSGILVMVLFTLKSAIHLHTLQKSALPLQNKEIRSLYDRCLTELHITRDIPIYSTAFLKSPVIVGLWRPHIYLPIHLISDFTDLSCHTASNCTAVSIRYMLLHELQHYKHKDALVNYLMTLAGILYWFNPLVWFALKEIRTDREIACDSSVLQILDEDDYEAYGNTLINFAEKISLSPFTSGISSNMQQMKKRIINIAAFEKPTAQKKMKSIAAFCLIMIFLLGTVPALTAYAAENQYHWDTASKTVSYADLSAYFEEYDGSFVLYDLKNDSWTIHDIEHAALQVSPDSTYKIYDALFGLEEGIITAENSFIAWNHQQYPFELWNSDQTLPSAMTASVNWYFQEIDRQLGAASVYDYIQKIGYGNKDTGNDLSSYWLESSLKISPIEQVELLTKLYRNDFDFAQKNIDAVKEAICLSSSETETYYGKTGTGRVNALDINGWFIGYAETADNVYFFATNITANVLATGSHAAEITMQILSDMNILSNCEAIHPRFTVFTRHLE